MPVNRACYVPPPSPPAYTPQTTVVVCCPLISDPVLRASVCAIFVNVWFGASPVNCLIDRQTVLIIAAFVVTAELSWVCIVYWTVANPVVVQRLCLSLLVSLFLVLWCCKHWSAKGVGCYEVATCSDSLKVIELKSISEARWARQVNRCPLVCTEIYVYDYSRHSVDIRAVRVHRFDYAYPYQNLQVNCP